jgi:hypothetical protein
VYFVCFVPVYTLNPNTLYTVGIIEEAAQKAKEGMEEWNNSDRPDRKVS